MSIFEVMGPIMIGPSSSHTAGAAKLGRMARLLFADKIEKVVVNLHGSFANTAGGHGTDRAVIGGLLGFLPDDERIRTSFKIAEEEGMDFEFKEVNLRDVHPNTLMLELYAGEKNLSITGSSIGGGRIVITKINQNDVNLTGRMPTLWILHRDRPGEVGKITSTLGYHSINIAFMQVYRNKKGDIGSCIIELDQVPDSDVITSLEKMENVLQVRYLPSL
ncbi:MULTISPECIES: L-serine ammonia-lyase, iron-sulfur-dependent subunit beta [unclassified Halanaerobium]|uniref:L-serine ammonia-lyase, iron-sulfur-dependent subunit beta n=1 Tax=unclassified Halanaerobium TaxID=2641197 RepID=UPI000DF3D09F|nr:MULTISPECIES: L-serine ammonia-lyase, iron-sulfur-dependent subunit beta [unclassified Halanaerobium]RCW43806.1 L-serine dehydratase [Halanaerobium sp. MA284_MarDTE_T2]RCW80507.1 L-serine dehydratase [Halanaerobium sp. DL-01]